MNSQSIQNHLNKDAPYVFLLVFLATAVRAYLYWVTCVISRDGVTFLSLAEYFQRGNFIEGLSHDYHPLYPVLIGFFFYPLKDFQLAGQIVSIIAGSLLVLPVFHLGKSLFSKSIGFGAGLFVAFHPYLARFSTDVLSDSLYIFFFITGVYVGWKALQESKSLYFFTTGICSALAYLTRPEGVGILIVVGFWLLFIGGKTSRLPMKRVFACVLVLVFGFLVVASPYLLYIRGETGQWSLTKKKNIKDLVSIEIDESESTVNHTEGLKKVLILSDKIAETFHPILFLLCLVTLFQIRRITKLGKNQWYIFSFFVLYLPILYFLLLNIGYVSRRHILPVTVVGLMWASFGVEGVRHWIVQKIHRKNKGGKFSSTLIYSIILILTVSILLPKTLKPIRVDKLWMKQVGFWIKEHSEIKNLRIVSMDSRIAYYAGGQNGGNFDQWTKKTIKGMTHENSADYVVLRADKVNMDAFGSFSVGTETLNLVHEFEDHKRRRIMIYKVHEG